MAAVDEDALRCDFAQVYHIFDFRRLPLRTAAVFAQGLPADARIMRLLSGFRTDTSTALLARLVDEVATIRWMLSDDGQNGRNRPKSISQALLGDGEPEKTQGFASAADFRAAWVQITKGSE